MKVIREKLADGTFITKVASIPTEEIIVKSKVDYIPQYLTDVYGETTRVTKDVTLVNLINIIRKEFPKYEFVSIGTPVNFDIAPTHVSRVIMNLKNQDQVDQCLKEISVSDMMIRTRLQPAWDWDAPVTYKNSVILHVNWYDTVYFMQFKDIFLGEMHCRYSAKFGLKPKEAKLTHYRYNAKGMPEEIKEFNEAEKYADSIKDQVEFLRVFRDGKTERT
jgi:hypothetical protein